MPRQKLTTEQKQFMLFACLQAIPPGKVMTYGNLAQLAGLGRAARWVGTTLSQLPSDSSLPWHRVVAAGGKLSLSSATEPGRIQRQRLQQEGVVITQDRVCLAHVEWCAGRLE